MITISCKEQPNLSFFQRTHCVNQMLLKFILVNPFPPNTPAKVISLIPSGSGITAANVCEGGPPTKQLTFKGTPFLFALV